MHDRIKELAEQALRESVCIDGVYRPEGYPAHASKTFTDRFAVLIIQESIAALDNEEEYTGSAILHKHFGVKE